MTQGCIFNNPDEILEGDGQEFYTLAPTPLTFRSTAPLNELQEVQINGVTVDPSNYTTEEGSTIVTFPIEYLQTLDVDSYEVSVVSDSKSAKGGFSVVAPESDDCGVYYDCRYVGHVDGMGEVTAIFHRDSTVDILVDGNPYQTADIEYGEKTFTIPMLGVSGHINNMGTKISMPELDTTLLLIYEHSKCVLSEHGVYYGKPYVFNNEALIFCEDGVICYADGLPIDSVTAYVEYNGNTFYVPFYNLTGVVGDDGKSITLFDSPFVLSDNYFYNGMKITIGDYLYTSSLSSTYGKGWGFKVIDITQSSYSDIQTEIQGYPMLYANNAFANCTNLVTAPIIPESVVDMYNAFANCTNLVTAPVIPEGVVDMSVAFKGCTNLVTAPVIPEGVTEIDYLFMDCVNLTGNVEINCTKLLTQGDGEIVGHKHCFENTVKPIFITGVTSDLNKRIIANTANNGNVTY